MFPYLFNNPNLSTFALFMILACFIGIIMFRLISTRFIKDTAVYNYYAVSSLIAILVGLFSAMLFQSFYNWVANGFRDFQMYGVTFMGGLIGGALAFMVAVLIAKPKVRKHFWTVANIAAPCLSAAHCIGRIGCFMGGCCHGMQTDSFLGVLFYGDSVKYVPLQLFEAAFLALLTATLLLMLFKFKMPKYNIIIYAFGYAVFRFIIEFFRGDDRGQFIPGLSPSQWQCILLLLCGGAMLFYLLRTKKVPFEMAEINHEKKSGGILTQQEQLDKDFEEEEKAKAEKQFAKPSWEQEQAEDKKETSSNEEKKL